MSALTRWLAVLVVGFVLSACSWFDFDDDHGAIEVDVDGPSVADVIDDAPSPVEMEDYGGEAPAAVAADPLRAQVAHPEMMRDVIARYEAVLPDLKDEDVKARVQKRVTDLRLEQGSLDLDQAQLKKVIGDYEELLASPASPAVREAMEVSVRYQLARAKELTGANEQALGDLDALVARAAGDETVRPLVQEAMFRRAEAAFSKGDYRSAAMAYEEAAQPDSTYYQHANYMLGWSRLKMGQSKAALEPFFLVVGEFGNSSQDLSVSEQELLADTLRASVMALEREEGVQTLAQMMQSRERPSWQAVLYVALGRSYLDQERYQDAAVTFGRFESENSLSKDAPSFALMAIDALEVGNFPGEVAVRRPDFVNRYGRGTEFHLALGDEAIAPYRDRLREFIDHLSAEAHATAQAKKGKENYLQAAHWYETWLTNFDDANEDANKVGEIMFLHAEALAEAQALEEAVVQYRTLVKRFPQHARARESSYAAVLGLTNLVKQDVQFADLLLASELDFADRFSDDPRAGPVQMHAARSLLERKDYGAAAGAAEDALARFPLNPELRLTAHQIAGEASSTLGNLTAAEGHFVAARDSAQDSNIRSQMEERLLATVSQQADQAKAGGQNAAAIAHLRRMAELAPNRDTAVQALLNVASIQTEANDLVGAAQQLEDLRRRYPDHALTQDIPLRLADLYEQQQQPRLAANELLGISRSTKDPEQARTAHYRAAELLLTAQASSEAEALLQDYVNRYPEPEALHAESIGKLAAMAAARNDRAAQLNWWHRQLQEHERSQDTRVRYLSAEAAYQLAEVDRGAFEVVALRQPLAASLKEKRAALEQALVAYERAAALGVGKFVTAATERSAAMYERLFVDVLASERPPSLSAEGLEKYEAALRAQGQNFVAKAIDLHEINVGRARDGLWDESIVASFQSLARVAPDRYRREERSVALLPTVE